MSRPLLLCAAVLAPALGLPSTADAAPAVKVIKVYYDSPGTDTRTNASINGEYAIVKNMTSTARSLKGWTLRDAVGHVYTFGTFTLGGGKSVIVYTGKGTNSSTRRYWGQTNYVWNNDKDSAILRTASGAAVHTCTYNSTAVDYKNC